MSTRLIDVTLDLWKQRNRQLTIDRVAQDTGLSKGWLQTLVIRSQKGCRGQSVDKVQTLYEYLTGKPLIND